MKAVPNPILVAAGQAGGSTTLSWTSTGAEAVEIRVDAPDGPLFSRSTLSGNAATGEWVRNGMTFYLQDVSGDAPLTSDHTLATVKVTVIGESGDVKVGILGRMANAVVSASVVARMEEFLQRYHPPAVGQARFGHLRRLEPFSRQFGFDRGRPIDRFYIERFIASCAQDIRGDVLEIGGDIYSRTFAAGPIRKIDVLSVEPNPKATIIADLAHADHLPSDAYDCVILAETLQLIYDFPSALRTAHRILRPGGVLLATFPGISQTDCSAYGANWCWSFTERSARLMFGEFFAESSLEISTFGNILSASAFLFGMAGEELTEDELWKSDPDFAVKVAVRARKAVSPR